MSKLAVTGKVRVSRDRLPAAAGVMLAVAGVLLASCSVGPNFHRPAAPPNDTYYHPEKETAPDTGPAAAIPTPGGAAAAAIPPTSLAPEASAPLPKQALNVGADLPAQWWQVFKSPALDQALKLSPDYGLAREAIQKLRRRVQ